MFTAEELQELLKTPDKLTEAFDKKFNEKLSTYNIDEDPRVKGVIEKKKELEGKVHSYNEKYKDVDLEKYNKLLQSEKQNLTPEQLEAYIQKELEKKGNEYQEVLKNKDTELNTLKEQIENANKEKKDFKITEKLNSLVRNEATKIRDKAFDKEKRIILEDFQVNEDGTVTRKDGKIHPTKGTKITLEDYIEDLKTNEPHIFDLVKKGTTDAQRVTQNGSTGAAVGNKLSIEEAASLRKTNPELYEQARKNGLLPF